MPVLWVILSYISSVSVLVWMPDHAFLNEQLLALIVALFMWCDHYSALLSFREGAMHAVWQAVSLGNGAWTVWLWMRVPSLYWCSTFVCPSSLQILHCCITCYPIVCGGDELHKGQPAAGLIGQVVHNHYFIVSCCAWCIIPPSNTLHAHWIDAYNYGIFTDSNNEQLWQGWLGVFDRSTFLDSCAWPCTH